MTVRVLLTGATGFVGRPLLRELLRAGCTVRAAVRSGSEGRLESPAALDAVVASADLFSEDASWWARACAGVDCVVHAAWYAEPGQYLQSPRNLDCLAGTLQAARGAVAAGVRRFVGVGTCFEYDLSGTSPLGIDAPLLPLTPYAAAKASAWLALSRCLPAAGLSFAWCRLFYLHGAGEDPRRLVPYLRERLASGQPAQLTEGRQVRDFLEVGAAARRIAEVALGRVEGAVNVCSGVPVTVRQLAERIADEYGRRDLLQFGARPDNLVDPACVVGIPGPFPGSP